MSANFKWLTKYDIAKYAQVTINIDDRLIDVPVNDAYLFDVAPVLSDAMLAAIQTILEINPIQWSRTKTYVANDKVFADGIYYNCVTGNTDSQPPTANWEEIELMTFWTGYVKPYFAMSAYSRFLLWQGANITQYGIVQPLESNGVSQPITDKWRGELLADVKSKVNIYLSRLNKQFDTVSGVFDGVTYTVDSDDNTTPTRGSNIWGVGYPNTRKIKCPNEYPYGNE